MESRKNIVDLLAIASKYNNEKEYWINKLSGELKETSFPYDFKQTKISDYKTDIKKFRLNGELFSKIMWLSNESDHRLYILLVTGLILLIKKYTNNNDSIIGAPVYNKNTEGVYANIALAIRNQIDDNMTFKDLVLNVKKTIDEAIENQNYPIEILMQHLSNLEFNYESSLFDIAILLENIQDKKNIEGFNPSMTFSFTRLENCIEGVLEYNSLLYEDTTIDRIITHFMQLLRKVIFNVDINIDKVEIMTEEEKCHIIDEVTGKKVEFPKYTTIQELFEEQVKRTPDNIAVVFGDNRLTYRELNNKANGLASILRTKGVKSDIVVGLILDNSIDMIVSILAVLKAGGAYLPIDIDTPQSRIKSMLDDCQVSLILTKNEVVDKYSFTALQNIQAAVIEPYTTNPRPQITNLDGLPFPDRSLVDYEEYSKSIGLTMVKNIITLQGTRGCPYNCAYCHKIWPKSHYTRSAENIFEEVMLYYRLGVRRFAFVDDIFNLNVKNSNKFFGLIIENNLDIQIYFPAGLRGDILTKEYIDLMVRAGTVSFGLALETASKRLQKFINKNLNIDKLSENIKYICEKYPHVILEIFIMHGFPTESEEEAKLTLDFIKKHKWIHFPYLHILKIYPNTDMEKLALANGISKDAIINSTSLAYHNLPDTLPFDKSFTLQYQSDFLNEYFLLKERLLHVLPYQMKVLNENELVEKYNSYLPVEISSFNDLLEFTGITKEELNAEFIDENSFVIPDLNKKINKCFPEKECSNDALRVLLLDTSQYFSDESDMLYDVVEPPLGLMYLMTYLNEKYGNEINGRIAKARVDFDSYEDLKRLLEEFKPNIIGIRTLTYYKDFFHKIVAMIRQWGFDIPIFAGGPYGTSDYKTILQDKNIDFVVLGEGEETTSELIGKIISNNGNLPCEDVLKEIQGISFIPNNENNVNKFGRKIIMIDELTYKSDNDYYKNLDILNKSTDLAYIIFTSGTTGKPKGVMVEHKNVVQLMKSSREMFDFCNEDIWTMFHSYCFDFSVWEMFGALLYGGKLIVIPKLTTKDPKRFLKVLREEKVTVLNQVPSAFYNLINDELEYDERNLSLRYVIFGGEKLSPYKLKKWKEKYHNTRLINMYGITEITVHGTFKEINDNEIANNISNIGKPLPNVCTYVMDNDLNILPIGVPGELCVGGEGIVRGYLNRTDLNKEKFVVNQYRLSGKLYKSGDLVRLLNSGELEYLGRIDQQVKIRGYRVELGEIESQLLRHESIKEVTVIVREENDGNKYLCAHFVRQNNISIGNLRDYLSKYLPKYMIPAYFIELDKIPLTKNGKIDRKELLKYHTNINTDIQFESPNNEIEEKLVEIWKKTLNVDQIGVKSNFFDIGGDSIKAIRLISLVNSEFNVDLKITDLYSNKTIEKLAKIILENKIDCRNYEFENVLKEINDIKNRINIDNKLQENIEDIYPMSEIQKGMVFHSMKNTGSCVYHNQMTFQMKYNNFETNIFKNALTLMVEKHSILRTGFNLDEYKEPLQIVYKNISPDFEHYNISNMKKNDQEKYIQNFLNVDKQRSFEFKKAPLWRIKTFDIGNENIFALLISHHSIFDGWSDSSFVTELHNTYLKLKSDPDFVPEKLKNTYKDYVVQQVIEKQNAESVNYWKNHLDGYKRLDLFKIFGKKGKSNTRKTYLHKLPTEVLVKLKRRAKQYNTSAKNVCFGAYVYMLNMISYQDDIVVGLVTNNRPICEDGDKILGCFLNTVPVRIKNINNIKWSEYIELINQKMEVLKKYDAMPLVEIIKNIGEKTQDRNPIFDVYFNYVDFYVYNDLEQNNSNRTLNVKGNAITNSLFDFTIDTTFEGFRITTVYDDLIIGDAVVKKLCRYYEKILEQFINNPEEVLNKDKIILFEEKQKLLSMSNDGVENIEEITIHELFEKQVKKTPNNIAVVFEGKYLTYRELNEKSNKFARVLRKKGVKADTIVGIMLERSVEMIVGIMAILKAGGAYLPVDPSYPTARIKYIIEDSKVNLVLTQDKYKNMIGIGETIDLNDSNYEKFEGTNLENINKPTDLAYVIYTSGSTGKPKGAMIEHKSVINRLNWMQRTYPINRNDRILQKTPYTFDVSVWELLWWFINGSSICFLQQGEEKNPETLVDVIEKNEITTIHFVPSMLNTFLSYVERKNNSNKVSSLERVFCSGEALTLKQLDSFNKIFNGGQQIKLINLYGPTEATIDVSYFNCLTTEKLETIPIGKPIDNIRFYIVDHNLHLQPIGVPGELCIAGVGLARGYINREKLTSEKFVQNIFMQGERIYRTGDYARWLQDGNIEFLGRIDNQIKIRGYRIELGEIENILIKHDDIKEAVVIVKDNLYEDYNNGLVDDKYLCAYIVSDKNITSIELREYLLRQLPNYMIPPYFVKLEKLPLTVNGKIDKKALLEMEVNIKSEVAYECPRNEIEEILVGMWQEILSTKEKIGVNDNFFTIGGHSLTAMVLKSRVYKELDVEVPLQEIFNNLTIKGIAEYINNASKSFYLPIDPIVVKENYPLSSGQKRMYVLDQLEKDNISYNMPTILELEGKVDKKRFEKTLEKLINRHESLRTSFQIIDGELVQKIHEKVDFKIEYLEVEEKEIDLLIENFVQPFDLSNAPLFRVKLVKLSENEYVLMIDTHHIISDGITVKILIEEFTKLYKGDELPKLRIQYKDYSVWQKAMLSTKELKKQEEYWLGVFKDEIHLLDIPVDYARTSTKNLVGTSMKFKINKQLSDELQNLANENKATLYMVLLAAYNVLLYRYTNQETIIVGSPIAGRAHPDLEGIVGMFVNTLAMKNYVYGSKAFKDFLKEVKENALKAYDNQDYQFENLVEKLNVKRNGSRNPIFQTMFSLQKIADIVDIEIDEFIIRSYPFKFKASRLDITFYASNVNDGIDLVIVYNTKLFKQETIEKLSKYYIKILVEIVKNPTVLISDIDIISEQDNMQSLIKHEKENISENQKNYLSAEFDIN
ncbi:non-ribosomal peptide synthetase [Abyssisolibacter fermentans]|uniref:non-ribosomal peptide synthetase n=1 Tax=Abyssisolibacter fermentans TaxID=1766203 RepID=UPI00082C8872|nr:non-ribosomal peptide synthetase [Abyssisolibacter fermentans]